MSHNQQDATAILISFCNSWLSEDERHAGGVAKLNLADHSVERLTLTFGNHGPKELNATGLATNGRYVFCVFGITTTEKNYVTTLDAQTLEFVNVSPIEHVHAAHSIVTSGDEVFIVSTGTDEIIRYTVDDGGRLHYDGVAWKASEAANDTHHVNSVTLTPDGDLICSAFGPPVDDSWGKAESGYIYNVTRDERYVSAAVKHTHSLVFNGDDLYYCLSAGSRLMRNEDEVVWLKGSYSRGLCFPSSDVAAVGTSKLRRISKRTGKPILFKTKMLNSCGIYMVNLNDPEDLDYIDLNAYNNEIYDLLPLYD